VKGTTASSVEVSGLRFRVGVPESLNHKDASTAPSPLNLSALFWSWNAGYKFIRLDGQTTGQPTGYSFHLGSTGCTGDPVACGSPAQFEVALDSFDPAFQVVVADVAALFSGSDLDANSPSTAPGCQGSPSSDADCGPLFERVGLQGTSSQVMFRAEPK
jgi:uncharacterized repeat protein (TIGR04052 family)